MVCNETLAGGGGWEVLGGAGRRAAIAGDEPQLGEDESVL